MHRVNRCTLAGTAWARPALTSIRLTIARSHGAHHAAPPPAPLGLRFRALLGLGFVPPPEPRPCAHCASIAYALLPAARVPLCRHRADPESSSRSLPSGSSARIAPIAPTARIAPIAPAARRCPRSPLALRRPRGHGWQESHRMHPFFAECAKKAPFLAASARNACSSRSEWQHPRPMHPFPGAIGRFRIHGARILPPRALFRVEEPEITHDAKMLPAPCGSGMRHAAWPNGLCALRRGPGLLAACAPPCHLACARRRPRSSPPSYTRRASPPASRPRTPPSAAPPIAVGMSCRSGSSCRPRAAHADASRPSMRARRHRLGPDPRQPSPSPEPTGPQPRASRVPAHPWSRLRPSAPCHPPRLTLPRGSRCGSGNSREMMR